MSQSRATEPFKTALLSGQGPARAYKRTLVFRAWVVLFWGANCATLVLLWFGHYLWAIPVFFLPAPWYAFQILNPTARGLGPVVTHFKTERREVWLTIDDGPDPESTPKILDLLKTHNARATFFLIGEKVQRHPELVTEIIRQGHSIGNHTHSHPHRWFWLASARKTAAEIDACAEALSTAGAGATRWFRSPVGLKNQALHTVLAQRDLDLVLWSARGFDTICRDPAKITARITTNLQPGAILLIHENIADPSLRTELFALLFAHLICEGYTCVIPPTEDLVR